MFFKFLIYYNAKPYFHIAPQARISAKIIFIVLNPFLKCWFTFLQAPFYLTSIHISDFMKKIPAHQSQRKCSCIHTDNKTCIFFFFYPFLLLLWDRPECTIVKEQILIIGRVKSQTSLEEALQMDGSKFDGQKKKLFL